MAEDRFNQIYELARNLAIEREGDWSGLPSWIMDLYMQEAAKKVAERSARTDP